MQLDLVDGFTRVFEGVCVKWCTMDCQLISLGQLYITWQHLHNLHNYDTSDYTNTIQAMWLIPQGNH